MKEMSPNYEEAIDQLIAANEEVLQELNVPPGIRLRLEEAITKVKVEQEGWEEWSTPWTTAPAAELIAIIKEVAESVGSKPEGR